MHTLTKRWQAAILILLLCLSLAGCMQVSATAEPTDVPVSTAVYYMDALPGSWDAGSAQTPEEEYLHRLTNPPLYSVADGQIVPGIAQLPEDVTAEYRGIYGVPADADRGYAFRVTLDSLCWEDGTAVSASEVLAAVEDRIGEYLWLAGAAEFDQGWERETANVISLEEAGFDSAAAAREAGYHRFYVDMEHFWGLEDGWSSASDRTRVQDYAMPAGLLEMYVTSGYLYEQYLADGMSYDHLQAEFLGVSAQPDDRMTMEDVGILMTGEKEFVVIVAEPVTVSVAAERLSGLYPVKQGADSAAYGPYRIASAGAEEIVLERNPFWQGDTAEYPADRILCRVR